jgi:hypothetical protein
MRRDCPSGHGGGGMAGDRKVGSGDDRTPIGVHEGLSCISCHTGHNQNARASCKTCHPADVHCGLDVEKMDTSYASATSKHNIHWVKCADCHQHGIPALRGYRVVDEVVEQSEKLSAGHFSTTFFRRK